MTRTHTTILALVAASLAAVVGAACDPTSAEDCRTCTKLGGGWVPVLQECIRSCDQIQDVPCHDGACPCSVSCGACRTAESCQAEGCTGTEDELFGSSCAP